MDTIFENAWILVVLFGIISSLAGKSKAKKEAEKKPQQNRPQAKPQNSHPDGLAERYTKVKSRASSLAEPEKRKVETVSSITAEQTVKEDSVTQTLERFERTRAIQGKAEREERETAERLMEGIVLSEILGPPKGRLKRR